MPCLKAPEHRAVLKLLFPFGNFAVFFATLGKYRYHNNEIPGDIKFSFIWILSTCILSFTVSMLLYWFDVKRLRSKDQLQTYPKNEIVGGEIVIWVTLAVVYSVTVESLFQKVLDDHIDPGHMVFYGRGAGVIILISFVLNLLIDIKIWFTIKAKLAQRQIEVNKATELLTPVRTIGVNQEQPRVHRPGPSYAQLFREFIVKKPAGNENQGVRRIRVAEANKRVDEVELQNRVATVDPDNSPRNIEGTVQEQPQVGRNPQTSAPNAERLTA